MLWGLERVTEVPGLPVPSDLYARIKHNKINPIRQGQSAGGVDSCHSGTNNGDVVALCEI